MAGKPFNGLSQAGSRENATSRQQYNLGTYIPEIIKLFMPVAEKRKHIYRI